MKKIFILSCLMLMCCANCVYAQGMVYDPTEYKVEENTNITNSVKLPSKDEIQTNINASTRLAQEAVSAQSDNFNNALFELDNAQVNIRNELLDYKAKYQEIDTQYQLIKEQRRILAEQIKEVENRIKAIEKSKNNIRKTMI